MLLNLRLAVFFVLGPRPRSEVLPTSLMLILTMYSCMIYFYSIVASHAIEKAAARPDSSAKLIVNVIVLTNTVMPVASQGCSWESDGPNDGHSVLYRLTA